MATYKTKGIIIKRTNLGEADRILTIFTQNFGKVKAIAKGVRKPLSKLAGNLELFCLGHFLLAEGRSLDIVAGAEVEKCYFNLRNSLKATQTAFYLAEIIDKMTEEKEPHREIFDLLENSLENLGKDQNKLLVSYFEINFLSESGFKPELYKCLSCNKNSVSGENYFSFSSGGYLCEKCRNTDSLKISDETIKILRLFLKRKISVIDKLKIEKKLLNEVKGITRGYLKYTSGKELKSEKFLQ